MTNHAANKELLAVAHTIASGAVDIAKAGLYNHTGRWGASVKAGNDADVVTAIDLEIDNYIRSKLAKLRSSDGIITEEGDEWSGTSGIVWVCDPIDGTASFASGAGSSSVSIAATSNGVSLAGLSSTLAPARHLQLREGTALISTVVQFKCQD